MVVLIPLLKPFVPKVDLDHILYSGKLSFGNYGLQFENKLMDFIKNDLLLLVNSYQNAFHIALKALNINPGDNVILSPLACLQTTQALRSYGLKLNWVDIDISLGTIDINSLKKVWNKNIKLVVHNHYCGLIGNIDEVNNFCSSNNIILIDDAIEAFGSEYKNKIIGHKDFSDATIFCFNPVRNPNSIEGGAISFRNKIHYSNAKLIRDYGINRENFRLLNGEINEKSDVSMTGYAATINELNSFIGLKQMDFIDEIILKSRNVASRWENLLKFKKVNYHKIFNSNAKSNYWVYSFRVNNREEIFNKFRKAGINSSRVHLPNNFYSVFNNQYYPPNVQLFYNSFISLPTLWWLDTAEQDKIFDQIYEEF